MKTKIKQYHICQNPNCGKEFPHRGDSKNLYCCRKCTDEGYSINYQPIRDAKKQQKIDEYYKNPKLCKNCSKILTYKGRKNNCCSVSCAMFLQNRLHPVVHKKGKCMDHPLRKRFPCTNIIFKKCAICSTEFIIPKRLHQRNFCKKCLKLDKKQYKKLCKFHFNVHDNKELYDEHLILKYGWYSPPSNKIPNYSGVTWDHLYPIYLGFINNIPPKIMSHAANAELIPFSENLRRYREDKKTITLEELYERIKLWDSGIHNLPKFYKE